MLVSWKKKRAIRAYIEKLPPELKKRYGGSGQSGYTAEQVRKTVGDVGLNRKYIDFALLLFCGEQVLKENGSGSESIIKLWTFLGSMGVGGGAGVPGNGDGNFGCVFDPGGFGGGESGGGDI